MRAITSRHYPFIFSFLVAGVQLFGQVTPPPAASAPPSTASAAPTATETIVLDPFAVFATPTSGYRAEKTVSGTLIATDVMKLPASVQIVTEAMLQDMGTLREEDSLRFVSGVGLSARNEGAAGGTRSERYVVRGFQVSQVLRNGIRMQDITNSSNIDRV